MAMTCPRCGSSEIVRIAYGYPGADMHEEVKRGEAVLGGCMVFPDSPSHECGDCGHWIREGSERDLTRGALGAYFPESDRPDT